MSKHTPGPWALRKEWGDSETELEVFPSWQKSEWPFVPAAICLVNEYKDKECEANARLIAAAPELLDALTDIVVVAARRQADGGDLLDFQDSLRRCGDIARAVIKKAEGGAQ